LIVTASPGSAASGSRPPAPSVVWIVNGTVFDRPLAVSTASCTSPPVAGASGTRTVSDSSVPVTTGTDTSPNQTLLRVDSTSKRFPERVTVAPVSPFAGVTAVSTGTEKKKRWTAK
jgi:hypothetical protein